MEYSSIQRDAAIQRFEYTVEAVWKCLKTFLEVHEGLTCASPKTCFREAKRVGMISESQCELALKMVDDRNRTAHTYQVEVAKLIYAQLKGYAEILRYIVDHIGKNIKE